VHAGDFDEEINEFEAGNRNVVIVFPDDLSESVSEGKTVNIPVYFDNQGASVLYSISEIHVIWTKSKPILSKLYIIMSTFIIVQNLVITFHAEKSTIHDKFRL